MCAAGRRVAVEKYIVDEAQRIGHGENPGQGCCHRQQPGAIGERVHMKRSSAKNISLDMKPLNSGTPAMAAAATIASMAVSGMYFHRPLIRRMSRVPVS